jgi:hypothetical protein
MDIDVCLFLVCSRHGRVHCGLEAGIKIGRAAACSVSGRGRTVWNEL